MEEGHGTENRLEARYSDTDGDLIADPPGEEAEWLDPPTVKFGYLSTEQDRYAEIWAPVLKQLSEKVGKPIEFVKYESPESQLQETQIVPHFISPESMQVPYLWRSINVASSL